jgi:hypothetical protein
MAMAVSVHPRQRGLRDIVHAQPTAEFSIASANLIQDMVDPDLAPRQPSRIVSTAFTPEAPSALAMECRKGLFQGMK